MVVWLWNKHLPSRGERVILQHWTLGYHNSRLLKKLGHLTYLHFFFNCHTVLSNRSWCHYDFNLTECGLSGLVSSHLSCSWASLWLQARRGEKMNLLSKNGRRQRKVTSHGWVQKNSPAGLTSHSCEMSHISHECEPVRSLQQSRNVTHNTRT